MDKLKLAHDWALVFTQHNKDLSVAAKTVSAWAFDYADAMQAEAEKRNKAEAEQKRKEIREILNDANNFIEREGQHFDDIEEAKREGEYFFKLFCRQNGIDDSEALCEVDWRVAPEWAKYWAIREDSDTALWCINKPTVTDDCFLSHGGCSPAPSFGFAGSHIVERPHGF